MMNTMIKNEMNAGTNLYLSIISACAWCGKIRMPGSDERQADSWVEVGTFKINNDSAFSHSICPVCSDRVRSELKAS